MFIHEAISEAMARNMCIKRKAGGWKHYKIYPSASQISRCIIFSDKGRAVPRWQPSAADLTADDWMLVSR